MAESWTANVTFGGKDRDLPFISASNTIYGLKSGCCTARHVNNAFLHLIVEVRHEEPTGGDFNVLFQ